MLVVPLDLTSALKFTLYQNRIDKAVRMLGVKTVLELPALELNESSISSTHYSL